MFTTDQIEDFKEESKKYPWMGQSKISMGSISFTDLMYHEKWQLLPPPAARLYFAVMHEDGSGKYKKCSSGSTISIALEKVNNRLWDTERRCGGADLSGYEVASVERERQSSKNRRWNPFEDWHYPAV